MARLEAQLAKLDKLRRKARQKKAANKAALPWITYEQSAANPNEWRIDGRNETFTTAQVEAIDRPHVQLIYKNAWSTIPGYRK